MQQIQKEEEEDDWNGLEWWLLRGKPGSLTDVKSSFLFAVTVGNYNTLEYIIICVTRSCGYDPTTRWQRERQENPIVLD